MKRLHIIFDRLPRDLTLAVLLTSSCTPFVFVPPLNETPVRIIPGLLLVLFLPGYSLIAALFPGRGDPDGIERIALSFGVSIAVVPLIGLALNYTPFGSRLGAGACRVVRVHALACCDRWCAEAGASWGGAVCGWDDGVRRWRGERSKSLCTMRTS